MFRYSRRLSYTKRRSRRTSKSSEKKSLNNTQLYRQEIHPVPFPFLSLEFLPILKTLRVRARDNVVTELRHEIDNAFVRFSFRSGIPSFISVARSPRSGYDPLKILSSLLRPNLNRNSIAGNVQNSHRNSIPPTLVFYVTYSADV